jgi:hypothetical protein
VFIQSNKFELAFSYFLPITNAGSTQRTQASTLMTIEVCPVLPLLCGSLPADWRKSPPDPFATAPSRLRYHLPG